MPGGLEAGKRKEELRRRMLALRKTLPDRAERSRQIAARVLSADVFRDARTIMIYVALSDEVATETIVEETWQTGKQVLVPYISGRMIHLFRLAQWSQLSPGHFGVLEPTRHLRDGAASQAQPTEIDLVIAPGLAFDPRGGRVGYGKGYYDDLLKQTPTKAMRLGVAFQCQVLEQVPMLEHDAYMDQIITEAGQYDCRAARAAEHPARQA